MDEERDNRNLQRRLCERCIQKFVTEQSSVLIIMVTRLSKQQESLIRKLQKMLSEPKN